MAIEQSINNLSASNTGLVNSISSLQAAVTTQMASSTQGFNNTLSVPAVALPYEVTAITGGIGTGAGGINGTYAGGVSGGPAGFRWHYTIANNTLASYVIDNPGISATNTAPTLSLPSGGLTGATVPTATVGTIPVNRIFKAPDSTGNYYLSWINSAGALASYPVGGTQYSEYNKAGVDASISTVSNSINQSDSFRISLTKGMNTIGTSLDRAMLQASNGVVIDFINGIFRLGTINSSSLSGTGSLTFSRASSAYALNAAGVYQSYSTNVIRSTNRGALLEGASTQICSDPVDLSLVGWSRLNATVTAIAGGAPDGIGNSYRLVESVTATNSCYIQHSQTISVAGNYTVSAHFKRGNNRYASLFIILPSGSAGAAIIDFDAIGGATVVSSTGAGFNPLSTGIQALANGIYRVWAVVSATTGTLFLRFAGFSSPAYTDRVYSMTSGNIFTEVSWVQVESGNYPTSPILIGGATRAADTASLSIPSGSGTDQITFSYAGGNSVLLRSNLASATSINLITDVGGPWLGNYLTSILLAQDIDESVIALTPTGAKPYITAINNTFYWNGVLYPSELAMLSAAGGSGSMGTMFLGGYVAPDAVNLLADVDFNITSSQFSILNNATATISSGYLQLNATGPTYSVVSRAITGNPATAYKFSATVKTDSDVTSINAGIAISNYASSFNIPYRSGVQLGASASDTVLTTIGASTWGKPTWVGLLMFSGTGTLRMKNPVLQIIKPAKDFPSGNIMVKVVGTAPNPLPSSTQVIWQADCGQAYDRARLEIRTDGSVHLTAQNVNGSGTPAQLIDVNLGSLVAGQSFTAIAGINCSQGIGSLNGSVAAFNALNLAIPSAYFRMGKDNTGGSVFGGTITGYAIYDGVETGGWMSRNTGGNALLDKSIWVEGDSYSSYSTGIYSMLIDEGYDIICTGVGGSTLVQQLGRITDTNNLTSYHNRALVWWDGSQNGRVAGCVFTGSISGTTLTVSSISSGTLTTNQLISNLGSMTDTWIVQQLTGTTGGVGTYQLSKSQAIVSGTMNAWNDYITFYTGINALGHNRWLYIHSGQISSYGLGNTTLLTSRAQEALDMDSLYRRIIADYGSIHAFDPFPLVVSLYKGTYGDINWLANQSDIAYGFYPRDLTMDGVHLSTLTRIQLVHSGIVPALNAVLGL